MSARVTFICDACEKQYMIDEEMEVPPHWFILQLSVVDKDGLVPTHERDVFSHFCSQKCMAEFAKGDGPRERACLVDRDFDTDPEDDEGISNA